MEPGSIHFCLTTFKVREFAFKREFNFCQKAGQPTEVSKLENKAESVFRDIRPIMSLRKMREHIAQGDMRGTKI